MTSPPIWLQWCMCVCVCFSHWLFFFFNLSAFFPLIRTLNDAEAPLRPDGDDYDPHVHRNIAHPTTYVHRMNWWSSIKMLRLKSIINFDFIWFYFLNRNFETLVHLLKGSLGTGILAMPKGFHQAGYLNGIVCTFLIGFICTYGLHILVRIRLPNRTSK